MILLNPASSPYYETTKAQAMKALAAWPGGFQIGGGIHDENAEEFLEQGLPKSLSRALSLRTVSSKRRT